MRIRFIVLYLPRAIKAFATLTAILLGIVKPIPSKPPDLIEFFGRADGPFLQLLSQFIQFLCRGHEGLLRFTCGPAGLLLNKRLLLSDISRGVLEILS